MKLFHKSCNNIFGVKGENTFYSNEEQDAIEQVASEYRRIDTLLWDIDNRLSRLELWAANQTRAKCQKKHMIQAGNCNNSARVYERGER